MTVNVIAWAIIAIAVFGVITRPFRSPEYLWAAAGALLLLTIGVVPVGPLLGAVGKGTDVYLFLIGMMLLSEVAREEKLFDWLAGQAVHHSRGSAGRLFAIIYAVGILVTVFLSNDATAVVLTPAVAAAARAAKAKPLPYLLICAFIANAASFVLPISNPANLVLYGDHLPPLPAWLARFALPAVLAIGATFVALRLSQRRELSEPVEVVPPPGELSASAKLVAAGIAATAIVLLVTSTLGAPLGLPTFIAGTCVATAVLILARKSPLPILGGVSWSVLPLVAGLFVLVEGLARTGVIGSIAAGLRAAAAQSPDLTAGAAGAVVAFGSNLVNNLPMGLVAATTSQAAQVPERVTDALLVGVDLGPNLSVTGSLATILWLIALRREKVAIGGWQFLRLGLIIMPPALLLALFALLLQPH